MSCAVSAPRISLKYECVGLLPSARRLWLAGAAAITGAPPFGLFLSELVILRGGLQQNYGWAVAAMIVLLIVIFIGFLNHFREMYFAGRAPKRWANASLSGWCVAPMWLALAPLATVRPVVAARSMDPLFKHRAAFFGWLNMNVAQQTAMRPEDLRDAATRLRETDGRMQMGYAWYPEPDRIELRYVATEAGSMSSPSGAANLPGQFRALAPFGH